MKRAVFLDRDGTLIEEAGYLDRLDRLELFPYSVDAVRLLSDAGFAVVVVSNQAGVARGIVQDAFVGEANRHIAQRVAAGGGRIEAFYVCPHHPDGVVEKYRIACGCRKPKPGLFTQAAADLDIDLARSFVVGDRWHDIEAGQAVGATGVLVRTGYGATEEVSTQPHVAPATIADTLIAAVSWILQEA